MVWFQSPQWGSNSKADALKKAASLFGSFSPRNGEVILKLLQKMSTTRQVRFSPRNGEVILKFYIKNPIGSIASFSPRNGEVILKST